MLTRTRDNGRSEAEFQAVRKDIKNLKHDLRQLMRSRSRPTYKDRMAEATSRLVDGTKLMESAAEQKLQDAYQYVNDQSQVAVKSSRKNIAKKPLTYVLSAFCVGLGLGALISFIKE